MRPKAKRAIEPASHASALRALPGRTAAIQLPAKGRTRTARRNICVHCPKLRGGERSSAGPQLLSRRGRISLLLDFRDGADLSGRKLRPRERRAEHRSPGARCAPATHLDVAEIRNGVTLSAGTFVVPSQVRVDAAFDYIHRGPKLRLTVASNCRPCLLESE